jgi:5-oxoprolinase (ATP-hydrolysing) subunit A
MASARTIDLNADAGESFGSWRMGMDDGLFPLVTSVNLACGFHAGDPLTMLAAVRHAVRAGVAIGAHPGFPDLIGFGRRDIAVTPDQVYADVVYQVGALRAMVEVEGGELHHVKPHGALYLRMARDIDLALAVTNAVRDVSPGLPCVVLAGPGGAVMREAAERARLPVVTEAFPDRAYLPTGELATRATTGAVLRDPPVAARRAVQMAVEGSVEAIDGTVLALDVETLCIHGDNLEAVAIATAVREALEAAGVELRAF